MATGKELFVEGVNRPDRDTWFVDTEWVAETADFTKKAPCPLRMRETSPTGK